MIFSSSPLVISTSGTIANTPGRSTPTVFVARYGRLGLVGAVLLALAMAPPAGMLRGGLDGALSPSVFAVFAGAVAAGLIGFAFSAIAGAILFHFSDPITAVPLLLACSITTQCMSIATLWRTMNWQGCLPFLAGGIIGIPVGSYLLQSLPPGGFVAAFGAFLACYSLYFLLRPLACIHDHWRSIDMLAGLAGGVTGGAAAFPGAIPTIWCGLRGLSKDQQRGIVQPFILVMQVLTVVYFSRIGIITSDVLAAFALCAPVVILGTLVGLKLYRRINDAGFRRLTLVFLFISGALLVIR